MMNPRYFVDPEMLVIYRFHALKRMFERNISEEELLNVLNTGVVVEDYPTDQPYPSRLILGFCKKRALHVVVAEAKDIDQLIVITVYEPDFDHWEPGFKMRKK